RLAGLSERSARAALVPEVRPGRRGEGEAPAGPAVHATLTLTFAGWKRGLVTGVGPELAGEVEVVPIGMPEAELARGVTTFVLEPDDVARHFPPRPRDAHKGTYGHLLIVAGSLGK